MVKNPAVKLSKYFITVCFLAVAFISIWFNYDKFKNLSENIASKTIEKVEQFTEENPKKEIDSKEAEVTSPEQTHEPIDEKKLESLVQDYLIVEEQLNLFEQSIEKSDYQEASTILKKLKYNSHKKETDELLKELDSLEAIKPVNLFPGNSRLLVWMKSIFSVDLIQDSKANEKKKELLERLKIIKLEASKQLKQNMKQ